MVGHQNMLSTIMPKNVKLCYGKLRFQLASNLCSQLVIVFKKLFRNQINSLLPKVSIQISVHFSTFFKFFCSNSNISKLLLHFLLTIFKHNQHLFWLKSLTLSILLLSRKNCHVILMLLWLERIWQVTTLALA